MSRENQLGKQTLTLSILDSVLGVNLVTLHYLEDRSVSVPVL